MQMKNLMVESFVSDMIYGADLWWLHMQLVY